MGFFAAELRCLIKDRFDGSQQSFSTATGIDPSMVSRQCSGRSLPDSITIQKAVSCLTPRDSALLVAAYLKDVCPLQVRDRIQIQSLGCPDIRKTDSSSQCFLDISPMSPNNQTIARSVVKWLQEDAAAANFLNHTLSLIGRSDSRASP
jgi:hypothetical protein